MTKIKEAIQLMEQGKTEEAMQVIQRILKHPTDDERYVAAEFYMKWGYYEESARLFEELLKHYHNEGQIIVQLAEIYIELEQDVRAITLLNDVSEDDEYYLESLLYLADLYEAQGLFEVTEQKLLKAKKLAPDEIVIDFAFAEFLFNIGQGNRAIPFYEKLLKQVSDMNGVSIVERLAECYATLGLYEDALKCYEEAKSENPDTLFKYGFTAFQHHENETAIHVWKKLIDIDPYYYTVYPELAHAMRENGMLKEAFDIAEKGLTYDEFNKELFLIAGQLATQLENEDKAFQYIGEAAALDFEYKEAMLVLIELYKQKEDFNSIINLLQDLEDKGVNDPIYTWEYAKANVNLEQYEEALKQYEKAYPDLKHDSDFLKEYGYFLSEEGRFKDALNVLKEYLQIEPLDDETLEFTERLNDTN